jgi:hypothetical protein
VVKEGGQMSQDKPRQAKTTSIDDIVFEKIDDLIEQATKEKSHYYVKSVLELCKTLIKIKNEEIQIAHNECQRQFKINLKLRQQLEGEEK